MKLLVTEQDKFAFRVLKWPIAGMVWFSSWAITAFKSAGVNEVPTWNQAFAIGLASVFLALFVASVVWFSFRADLLHVGLVRTYYSRLNEDLHSPRKAQRELRKKWQASDKRRSKP